MKARLLAFGAAGSIIAAAVLSATAPAQSQNYPWCAYYGMGDDGGGTNCGFVSYEQCMATLSGMGGFCVQNNQYHPPTGPSGQYRAARRSHKHRASGTN